MKFDILTTLDKHPIFESQMDISSLTTPFTSVRLINFTTSRNIGKYNGLSNKINLIWCRRSVNILQIKQTCWNLNSGSLFQISSLGMTVIILINPSSTDISLINSTTKERDGNVVDGWHSHEHSVNISTCSLSNIHLIFLI